MRRLIGLVALGILSLLLVITLAVGSALINKGSGQVAGVETHLSWRGN